MMLTNTALTPTALLSLLSDASEEVTLANSNGTGYAGTVNVVNIDTLRDSLEAMIKQQPQNLFADLVGMTLAEADAYIRSRCNNDIHGGAPTGGRNKAGTPLPLVSTTTILFEDGRETQALYERTNALRGTSGMITGKGLGIDLDLCVSVEDGKISEIIHYGE